MHCWSADRPDAGVPAVGYRPWDALDGQAAPPGRVAGGVDRPGDGRRSGGRRGRPQPHVVHEPRRSPGKAALRRPACRDRAQPGASAPMEGRAARWRLRVVFLLRANRARGGGRDHRRLGGDAARRARVLSDDRGRAGRGDLQRRRHRGVPAGRAHRRTRAVRDRSGAAFGCVRRTHHAPEGASVPARRRARIRPAGPARALRRCTRHTPSSAPRSSDVSSGSAPSAAA